MFTALKVCSRSDQGSGTVSASCLWRKLAILRRVLRLVCAALGPVEDEPPPDGRTFNTMPVPVRLPNLGGISEETFTGYRPQFTINSHGHLQPLNRSMIFLNPAPARIAVEVATVD